MIGRIKGTLLETSAPDILVDVQGVGYELQVPMSTLYRLPQLDQDVCLYTHLVVREDAQLLYGFYDDSERTLFRNLIRVSGVGPKVALAILSGISADDFVRVVQTNDAKALEALPGIGKKTAERLVIEMRDKLKDWLLSESPDAAPGTSAVFAGSKQQPIEEAEHALVALGYKPKEAEQAVSRIAAEGLSSQELIREALKQMVKA